MIKQVYKMNTNRVSKLGIFVPGKVADSQESKKKHLLLPAGHSLFEVNNG